MRTQRDGDVLTLNEDDYTVAVDGATTRYASENNGIVVEVTGSWIAIQSTEPEPPIKQSTSEEAFSTASFVE